MGRFVTTHGVRGELRFLPYAFPCPTLHEGLTISLQEKDGSVRLAVIESVRSHPPFLLVRLQEVTSLSQAQLLRDCVLMVEERHLPPLKDGEFYHYQLIGLAVETTSGEPVGVISHIFFSGGHDVWVIRQGKKEFMIPAADEIIRSIDIPGKRAVIEPLEGLLE